MSSSPPLQEKENSQESEDIEILKNNADLSSEDFRRIQELFNLFDEDNSGSMSSAELGKLMRSLGISLHFHLLLSSSSSSTCSFLRPGMFPTDLEVEALVASMDEDKSGQIELQELVKHMGLQVRHPDIHESDF